MLLMQSISDRVAYIIFLMMLFIIGVLSGALMYRNNWWPIPHIRDVVSDVQSTLKTQKEDQSFLYPHGVHDIQVGTYIPDKVADGLVLLVGVKKSNQNFIRIIERNGDIVHEWIPNWFEIWGNNSDVFPEGRRPKSLPGAILHGVALASNGDMILNFEHLSTIRLSPCNNIVWKLDNLGHHSVHIDSSGNIWVGAEIYHSYGNTGHQNHLARLRSWTIQKISPDGDILETTEVIDILRKNDLLGLLYMSSKNNEGTQVQGDTLHLNDVETFPGDMDSVIFAAGDVMVSLRNINTVFVMDPKTHHIKYRATGKFLRQHDPDFIGGDNIIVFDNRNLFPSTEPEAPNSRILEIDAAKDAISVRFSGENDSAFFTNILGKQQLLHNGNLLITVATQGRVIEVAQDGSLVWEYQNVVDENHNGLLTQADLLPQHMDRQYFEDLIAECAFKN